MLDQEWVDADCGHGRHIRIRAWSSRLLAERRNFARRILSFERGEIDHGDRGLESPHFRAFLDAARGEFGYTLFYSDLIYSTDLIEQLAEARALKCSSSHSQSNIASGNPHYNDENGRFQPGPKTVTLASCPTRAPTPFYSISMERWSIRLHCCCHRCDILFRAATGSPVMPSGSRESGRRCRSS